MANNGTLFLDEIGDMALDLQSKMLRFLQERVIERVGGVKEILITTRVICATHQPLKEMIKSKTFREDLYFRLNDINIDLPPLRERDDDILLLAKVFLERYAKQQNKAIKGLSPAAEYVLQNYECQGNVRELEQIIRRAVIMSGNDYIQPDDLLLSESNVMANITLNKEKPLTLSLVRRKAETLAIYGAMEKVDGNVSKAAKLLDVSRPTLYALIERLDIDFNQAQ